MEFDQFLGEWLKIRGCTFSDVDITLLGYGLTLSHLNRLSAESNESSLLYQFDISIFSKLTNPALIEQIEETGVVLYQ